MGESNENRNSVDGGPQLADYQLGRKKAAASIITAGTMSHTAECTA